MTTTRSRFTLVAALAIATFGCSHSSGGTGGNGNGNGGGSGGIAGGGGGMAAAAGGTGGIGGGGTGGTGGGGGTPADVTGCPGQTLYALPTDPSAPGPWPVGAKTVTLAGLTTEVWYPATLGSDAGQTPIVYDIREHLPPADAAKIPDSDNPPQNCNCFRDLPLDQAHGPYPLVVFIHGTAAFRTQSLTFMTHWASRGFVVVSADHPGIELKDILGGTNIGTSDEAGDTNKALDALAAPSGDLAFLVGHLDGARIAVSGHSAGGSATAGFGNRAQVLIPMAAMGVSAGSTLKSTLVMGAGMDGIAQYTGQQMGYSSSPKPKRLVGLGGDAGHLAFSDLCAIGADKGGILQIAEDHGIMVNPLIAALAQDGCKPGQLAPDLGWHVVNFATSAVLEETLQCSQSSAAQIAGIANAVPNVQEYQQDLSGPPRVVRPRSLGRNTDGYSSVGRCGRQHDPTHRARPR